MPEDLQSLQGRIKDNAPEMYRALKECASFIEDIICRNCEDCSLKLDAEGLREYLEGIFARIESTETDNE